MGMRRRFGGGMDELVKESNELALVLELPLVVKRIWA